MCTSHPSPQVNRGAACTLPAHDLLPTSARFQGVGEVADEPERGVVVVAGAVFGDELLAPCRGTTQQELGRGGWWHRLELLPGPDVHPWIDGDDATGTESAHRLARVFIHALMSLRNHR